LILTNCGLSQHGPGVFVIITDNNGMLENDRLGFEVRFKGEFADVPLYQSIFVMRRRQINWNDRSILIFDVLARFVFLKKNIL